MEKKVLLTNHQFASLVKKMISESLSQESELDKRITIITYYLDDENDRKTILQYLDEIYDILVKAYESIGGLIGLKNKDDILKNKNNHIIRIAFYYSKVVAVAIYNKRLGGNKLTYGGGIKGQFQEEGKIGFKAIIRRDVTSDTEYNWIEASGTVEHLFKKYGGLQVPSKFAEEIFGKNKVRIVDDFHYERIIGGQNKIVKAIFGAHDEGLIERVAKEAFDFLYDELVNTNAWLANKLKEYHDKEVNEAESKGYGNLYVGYYISIIADIREAYDEFDIHEFPIDILNILEKSIVGLKKMKSKIPQAQNAIDNGVRVYNSSTVFRTFKFQFSTSPVQRYNSRENQ